LEKLQQLRGENGHSRATEIEFVDKIEEYQWQK
jgi:hypothetical protein